ncbi:hypothetical protein L1987_15980 [Smallanthus sonchifolius]|uniref:Uncharacterized protein n=1 Tax=Smallanthus sonchifolius TaxID=185202 RepID=A0ACB9J829_9ASTR|nr:hypothetical protein L1987_15980 [Smallanthus sonchifolius]
MLGEILYVFRRLLFANSLLSIMQTPLDETRQDEMLIIGCQTLFDFVICQVDPYLCLIEDCKLTVGPGSGNISFGSKEDDKYALKSLSEIKFSEEQSMESLAATIVNPLDPFSINLIFFYILPV